MGGPSTYQRAKNCGTKVGVVNGRSDLKVCSRIGKSPTIKNGNPARQFTTGFHVTTHFLKLENFPSQNGDSPHRIVQRDRFLAQLLTEGSKGKRQNFSQKRAGTS